MRVAFQRRYQGTTRPTYPQFGSSEVRCRDSGHIILDLADAERVCRGQDVVDIQYSGVYPSSARYAGYLIHFREANEIREADDTYQHKAAQHKYQPRRIRPEIAHQVQCRG